MLPHPTGRKDRPFSDARTILEEDHYRCRCGIAWRDLPEVFGPWRTVWTWNHGMATDGTGDRVVAERTAAADTSRYDKRTIVYRAAILLQAAIAHLIRSCIDNSQAPGR